MPASPARNPMQNRILASLGRSEYARVQDEIEIVPLAPGQVLYASGESFEYVYFPVNCIVSLISTTQSGSSAQLAMTGNEGLVGIPLVLGSDMTTHRIVVQSAGDAYRVKAEILRWELDQGGELLQLTLRYTQALMTQMAQSVVCNRHHSVEQRLCRWLLFSLDLLAGDEIDMTHEALASMLGVRREGVTEAAGKLQAAGLLRYSRGHITLIDRVGLEARACECYDAVKSEYNRLFEQPVDVRIMPRGRQNPVTLRKRAEARLQQSQEGLPDAPWDNPRLLHELQVHQIELEMQLDELRRAYEEADALRAKYTDIYDFAPVAYFTLDPMGFVVELNLAGALLLGIKRSEKTRHRFAAYVAGEYLSVFNEFVQDVLHAKDKRICQINLSASRQRPALRVRIEAITDDGRNECRMVVLDISASQVADPEKTMV
jgi:CRP-like cAMP-binding protein